MMRNMSWKLIEIYLQDEGFETLTVQRNKLMGHEEVDSECLESLRPEDIFLSTPGHISHHRLLKSSSWHMTSFTYIPQNT